MPVRGVPSPRPPTPRPGWNLSVSIPSRASVRAGSRGVGLITVLLALAGWTVVPLLIKAFTGDVDGWTSNGWRYAFAALLWMPLLLVKWLSGSWPAGLWKAALLPSLVNAVAQVAFTLAFYEIDPGLVTFGMRVQIVAVTIGAAIMFPAERRIIKSPVFLAALALVITGTLLTVAQSPSFGAKSGVLGIGLAMSAGIGYAAYALTVRRCMSGFGPIVSFAAISQLTAVLMVGLMIPLGERAGLAALDMPPARMGLFLLSAAIGIAAGHVLYYLSIARLGVAVSTGVVQLQPFTVGVLSMLVHGETLLPGQWATGLIAVAGAMLMLWIQHHLARPPATPPPTIEPESAAATG